MVLFKSGLNSELVWRPIYIEKCILVLIWVVLIVRVILILDGLYFRTFTVKLLRLCPCSNVMFMYMCMFQSKLKVCALKVTSNINSLIKDLFHNPPSYKCIVTLSWRPAVSYTYVTVFISRFSFIVVVLYRCDISVQIWSASDLPASLH